MKFETTCIGAARAHVQVDEVKRKEGKRTRNRRKVLHAQLHNLHSAGNV